MPQLVTSSLRATRLLLAATALASLAGMAGCIDWNRSTSSSRVDIRLYISGMQAANGTQAVFNEGAPPGSGAGPTLTAVVPQIVLKGGSSDVTFTAPSAFSHLVVSVDGVTGYWDLDLGTPTDTAQVLIVYAQHVGGPAFWMNYGAGAGHAGSGIGPTSTSYTSYLGNGVGDVQVNITWNSPADLDLYVVDPFGQELYYANRELNSGGVLDIDSNAACATDGPRTENVYWPFGIVPPSGEYVVRVNNWSACGAASTDYVVTIRTRGGIPIIYRGRFTDPGVGGAVGAGRRISAFKY